MSLELILAVVEGATNGAFKGPTFKQHKSDLHIQIFGTTVYRRHEMNQIFMFLKSVYIFFFKRHLLIPKVATLVVKHITLCSEALIATLWTRVRPPILMDPHVNLEVLLLTESLITARKRTLVRLRPVMNVHVSLKANLSCEGLTAAWMLTDKKLRPFLSIG